MSLEDIISLPLYYLTRLYKAKEKLVKRKAEAQKAAQDAEEHRLKNRNSALNQANIQRPPMHR